MAEQLALGQVFGEGAAIDGDEGHVGALALLPEHPGDEFLAGARFAEDQHGNVVRGDLGDLRVDLGHHRRFADQNRRSLGGLNARLIYAHVTGYGEAGDDVERPGYDATAWWARYGMMDLIRPRGGELSLSAPGMGDHPTAVALFGAIMLALYIRRH